MKLTSEAIVAWTLRISCWRPASECLERGAHDMTQFFPVWTLLPFVILVLGIAALPLLLPNAWGKHTFQAAVALGCASPVVGFLLLEGHREHLMSAALSYLSFVATIGALYVTASGIFISGDI